MAISASRIAPGARSGGHDSSPEDAPLRGRRHSPAQNPAPESAARKRRSTGRRTGTPAACRIAHVPRAAASYRAAQRTRSSAPRGLTCFALEKVEHAARHVSAPAADANVAVRHPATRSAAASPRTSSTHAAKRNARARYEMDRLGNACELTRDPSRFAARKIESTVERAMRRRHDCDLTGRGMNLDDQPSCARIEAQRDFHGRPSMRNNSRFEPWRLDGGLRMCFAFVFYNRSLSHVWRDPR